MATGAIAGQCCRLYVPRLGIFGFDFGSRHDRASGIDDRARNGSTVTLGESDLT
jgi:hypothetical protein